MARIKNTTPELTRAEVETLVVSMVAAQLAREELVTARDTAILAIQNDKNPAIEKRDAEITAGMERIGAWARANEAEFGSARSMLVAGHTIGFHTGNPAVKPKKGKTLKAILEWLVNTGGVLMDKYVRTKRELDKEAILSTGRVLKSDDAEARAGAALELHDLGVEIEQAETFYLTPAREGQADTTLKKEAA
jgi:phage host-nuclease inhibitor protein Gam